MTSYNMIVSRGCGRAYYSALLWGTTLRGTPRRTLHRDRLAPANYLAFGSLFDMKLRYAQVLSLNVFSSMETMKH